MTQSFAQLKKNRTKQFDKLSTAAEEMNKKGGYEADDRYWRPTADKAGNGTAILRFLPAPPGEDVPFVRYWDHGFEGPGGWYIEKSLTTLGQDDPASDFNSKLWNSTKDDNSPSRVQARNQKRRLHYVSNIYVISDPANPDNNGKVFLYEYGKKIFDKLNDKMHPRFEGETPVNPFDLWEGCTFRMKFYKSDGQRTYEASTFDEPSPLFEDDGQLEAIWNSEHLLQPIIDPKEFKSYAELQARLNRVLGISGETIPQSSAADRPAESPAWTPPANDQSTPPVSEGKTPTPSDGEDDDNSLDFFKKLANEG